ncbi:signal transduction histidine kinase [Tahibacter aquaticus]|uniref:histidine kinase n=1 Tax=Tahibacter aquaticus TaxID=520092 RepID=A0A4R6Z799_9GAMM|nr:ATP-binding protein [Tahibacter aquaticus]TDR47632.1 signal transduction histidine kinase [Tahibacter aquaticus]
MAEDQNALQAPPQSPDWDGWQRYLLLFVLALLLLLGVGWAALSTGDQLSVTLRQVTQLQEATKRLSALLARVVDLETGQRGFLLTGEEIYLKPYVEAERNISSEFRRVDEALGDYPEAREELAAIELALAQKRGEIATSLAAYQQQGPQQALALVRSGEGNRVMEDIRGAIARLTVDGRGLIADKQAYLEKVIAQRNVSIFSALGLAIVASLAGVVLLRRHLLALRQEQKLRAVAERSDKASREKSAFLANMSHEIRTPMNAIFGFSQLLSERVTDPQDKRYVDAIVTSGRSLLALINDVLDLSRIEAGKLDVRPAPMSVRELIDSAQLVFSQLAADKGLQLDTRVDASLPDVLELDQARLRQMLFNLVGNAIKYTAKGHVHIRASATADADELHATVVIEVEDSGVGIAAEAHERIFEPFTQAVGESAQEGTGLGLSITRSLVHLMGGAVTLESAPGRGSRFQIRLPHVALAVFADDIQPPAIEIAALAPLTILVADDVSLNRQLIEAMFRGSAHRLLLAEDGVQAVALTRAHKPAVVLMDIRMPQLDGLGALAQIRADAAIAATPVIAVTASSLSGDDAQLRERFDGYLRKPITRERLLAELLRVLPPPPAPVEAGDDTPSRPQALPEVLRQLQHIEKERWPGLSASLAVRESARLAEQLLQLAQQLGAPSLQRYALRLQQAAALFDPAALESTLRDFPQQRAELAAYLQDPS